jgi:hypothetical protein
MTTEVIVHACYYPDGAIKEIAERPANLTGQQWFNFLCQKVPHAGAALAGGRHIFRLSPEDLEALKAQASA